jgi:thymidylate kinase
MIDQQIAIRFLSDGYLTLAKELFKQIDSTIPLICFEGLPGSGKSTQAIAVAETLTQQGYRCYSIDLPTENTEFGSMVYRLHKNPEMFNYFKVHFPELHPRLILLDFLMNILIASKQKVDFILMARGSISTVLLQQPLYLKKYPNHQPISIFDDMQYFKNGDLVFFLDLPFEVALQRVIDRNREPLRTIDHIDQMSKDRQTFFDIVKKLKLNNFIIVNGNQPADVLTLEIAKKIIEFSL